MTFSSQFSDYPDEDERLKVQDFENKSKLTSLRLWIGTLLKEIKLVLMLKDVIEYGDKSK